MNVSSSVTPATADTVTKEMERFIKSLNPNDKYTWSSNHQGMDKNDVIQVKHWVGDQLRNRDLRISEPKKYEKVIYLSDGIMILSDLFPNNWK
jgi:hypothetical protein